MSKLNKLIREKVQNHEGTFVPKINAEKQLRRSVLASMLWEDQFYIDGQTHADNIRALVAQVNPEVTAALAVEARGRFKLRHIPLLLNRELARIGKLSAQTLADSIQRADEMAEFLAIYWKDGKTAVSNQVKKGLAKAFVKFNEYQLAKYNRDGAIKLRDVMFISHPRPKDAEQEALFKRVANNELVTPDTWEVALSGGANKAETFSRLMTEGKLGALAFLKNLRGMLEAGVSEREIRTYAKTVNVDRVLPFRYISAARYVPQLEDMLEGMMLRSLATMEKIPGRTVLLVDVSGSMFGAKVSAKSELDRFDAAAALAMLAREVCEEVAIYSFSNEVKQVPPRSGFALREAISRSQGHGGTQTGMAIEHINRTTDYDRIVVFTDEQSYDRVPNPKGKGYILNVAAYQNGINSGAWTTVTGFSEATVDWIRETEKGGV